MKHILKYQKHLFCTVCAIALCGVVLGTPEPRAEMPEPWTIDLRAQLSKDHNCKLNFMTNVMKFELQGRQTIKARAHCEDKRAFDTSRVTGEPRFKIQQCDVVSC